MARLQWRAVAQRHERTVLARLHLDPGHGAPQLRWRAQAAAAAASGSACCAAPAAGRSAGSRSGAAPAAAPAPAAEKVTFATDTFFDFDKAVLRPESQAKLTDLVEKTKGVNVEVIIAVGHTDSTGPDSHNQKLSVRRADSVKNFLVEKGVEKNRIYTEGKGSTQPVADNKTREGRAKNRRVEVEVVGTRKR